MAKGQALLDKLMEIEVGKEKEGKGWLRKGLRRPAGPRVWAL